jgi:hypothetical protein
MKRRDFFKSLVVAPAVVMAASVEPATKESVLQTVTNCTFSYMPTWINGEMKWTSTLPFQKDS